VCVIAHSFAFFKSELRFILNYLGIIKLMIMDIKTIREIQSMMENSIAHYDSIPEQDPEQAIVIFGIIKGYKELINHLERYVELETSKVED
jgi:hypothetical protein